MQPNTHFYELTASEFKWQISNDRTINASGFNKQIPGPVLTASRGDTLIVKVKNELNEPTIVHWHGMRLPAAMDGSEESQRPILPGEVFEYRFVVPDSGTFWYHSHYNETEQMEKGMYGALIVRDDLDTVVDGERVFMIDDMKLSGSDFSTGNFFSRWIERHDGRQGKNLLINGKERPFVKMHAGQTERWRFINSSSARYFRLHLEGRPFKIIATDGGLVERSIETTEALITPGERLDILVGPFQEGERFFIESLAYNRMTFLRSKKENFAQVIVGQAMPSHAIIPGELRKIDPITGIEAPATRKIKFSVGASLRHGIDFLVNNALHTNDKPVLVGELQIWEIANTSLMDHPFHLHGFFFQVLSVNGKAPAYISWKDTINLPPGSTTKIAWVPDDRPGVWMYHCHILEHHEAGMMANFEVVSHSRDTQLRERHRHHHHH